MIAENLGNDLTKISNELIKLKLNLKSGEEVSPEIVEENIGVSKEYNVFELQAAIAQKNLSKALQIIQYFDSNPKAAPIQMVLPALYASFSKMYTVFGLADKSEAGPTSLTKSAG